MKTVLIGLAMVVVCLLAMSMLAGCESFDFAGAGDAAMRTAGEGGVITEDGGVNPVAVGSIVLNAILGGLAAKERVRAGRVLRDAGEVIDSVDLVRRQADEQPLSRSQINRLLDETQTPAAKRLVRRVKAGA